MARHDVPGCYLRSSVSSGAWGWRGLMRGNLQPSAFTELRGRFRSKAGFDESEACGSSACRIPRGSSYAFHLPDQRNSVVALPIGSGMSLRCRPQPCRRSGGQGQRLSGTAAPTLGGRPMPLSRFPLANCPPFLCGTEGGSAGALDRRFPALAQSWWRRALLRLFVSCFGPAFVMNIANSNTSVYNNVCNGVALGMENIFKINGLDQ